MKKVLSLCLVMVLVLSLMILPANAASVAKDLVVGGTYSEALELNKDNSTSWGGLPKINQHILYQFMLVSEGLKVKITIPANELELDSYIQINFNPDLALPGDKQGLFLSIVPKANNEMAFLQHNHGTKMNGTGDAGGVAITPAYTAKTEGGNYIAEIILPTSFFQVLGATENFQFDADAKLGYILFAVEPKDGPRASSSFSGIGESNWNVSTLQFKTMTFNVNPGTGDVSLIGYAVVALTSLFLKKKRY